MDKSLIIFLEELGFVGRETYFIKSLGEKFICVYQSYPLPQISICFSIQKYRISFISRSNVPITKKEVESFKLIIKSVCDNYNEIISSRPILDSLVYNEFTFRNESLDSSFIECGANETEICVTFIPEFNISYDVSH